MLFKFITLSNKPSQIKKKKVMIIFRKNRLHKETLRYKINLQIWIIISKIHKNNIKKYLSISIILELYSKTRMETSTSSTSIQINI